jgi:hypothetical protein
MQSDQELKFHRGQEFTKKCNSRLHCIVQSYVKGELAYLVSFTCSGHMKKISEYELSEFYELSSEIEKCGALKHLGESRANHQDDADEDGAPLSPGSYLLRY